MHPLMCHTILSSICCGIVCGVSYILTDDLFVFRWCGCGYEQELDQKILRPVQHFAGAFHDLLQVGW